jgi:uncharacterized membrane protein
MRGREVTRLEGFSDAVFGFALTLLVVSLEVPENFPALKQTLSGFLPFAATFAVVSWIWFEHYLFSRHLLSVAVGVVSILLALVVPMRLFWMPGFIYFLLGPIHGTNGHRTGVARARLKASLA